MSIMRNESELTKLKYRQKDGNIKKKASKLKYYSQYNTTNREFTQPRKMRSEAIEFHQSC